MNLSWLFNGTMEAHHLIAVYIAVWIIQGGYAIWTALQWRRARRESRPEVPLTQVTREKL